MGKRIYGNILAVAALFFAFITDTQAQQTLLVTGQGYSTVEQYDLSGAYIGSLFSGPLVQPFGVALHPTNGLYYVSDYATGSIERFQADGTWDSTFATGLNQPQGIVFDPLSEELYVREFGNGNYTILDNSATSTLLHNYTEDAYYVRWGLDGSQKDPTLHSNGGGDYYYWESGAPGSITWSHHVKFADWAGGLEFDPTAPDTLFTADISNSLGGDTNGEVRRWMMHSGDSQATDLGRFADLGAGVRPGDLLYNPATSGFFVSDWDSKSIFELDSSGAVVNTINSPIGSSNWGLAYGPSLSGASAPEPGTLGLLALGGGAGIVARRRRK